MQHQHRTHHAEFDSTPFDPVPDLESTGEEWEFDCPSWEDIAHVTDEVGLGELWITDF